MDINIAFYNVCNGEINEKASILIMFMSELKK